MGWWLCGSGSPLVFMFPSGKYYRLEYLESAGRGTAPQPRDWLPNTAPRFCRGPFLYLWPSGETCSSQH